MQSYILAPDAVAVEAAVGPLPAAGITLQVARIAMPGYLDTENILVRRGSLIQESQSGRLAGRLSAGATDLVTAELGRRCPRVLVSDQPQAVLANYRLLINVSRLDVTARGAAILDANWVLQSSRPDGLTRASRGRFAAQGSVANDRDVVELERQILQRLADAIDISDVQ